MHKPELLAQEPHIFPRSNNSADSWLPPHTEHRDGMLHESKTPEDTSASGHTTDYQNSEHVATAVRYQHSRNKTEHHDSRRDILEFDMVHLGEGVGTLTYDRSVVGSRELNHELRRRL